MTVRAGLAGQLAHGDQRGERRRRHDLAALVDDEAAVGVAVERQAEVRAVREHRGLQVAQVLRVDRVRLVVREGAVELEVQRHDRRAAARDRTTGAVRPPMPLPASTTTVSGRIAGQVDQALQVVRVLGQHVAVRSRRRAGPSYAGTPSTRASADLGEAGVQADRCRAGAAQLDAVVPRRVVARGEHRARARPGAPDAKYSASVETSPTWTTSAPWRGRAGGERGDQRPAARAHVVADDDGDGPPSPSPRTSATKAAPTSCATASSSSSGYDAAHVVRLDDAVEVARGRGGWSTAWRRA